MCPEAIRAVLNNKRALLAASKNPADAPLLRPEVLTVLREPCKDMVAIASPAGHADSGRSTSG